jgi:hypothetical protein
MERLLDFLQTHRDALIVGLVVAAVGAVVARSRLLIVRAVQRLAAAHGRRWVKPRSGALREPLFCRPARFGPGLAMRILEACNAEAAALYRSRMRGEPGTERQVAIWETTFERAWTPQRPGTFDSGFAATESVVALFCNLWVLLKDRANENEHEYCHRFFASRAEIVEWVEQTGCMRLREEIRGRYRLAPARFNEAAVRAVGDLLDRRPDAVDEACHVLAFDRVG